MANGISHGGNPPEDGFERYYAEKIWEWIPETYRHEDGLAEPPHILREYRTPGPGKRPRRGDVRSPLGRPDHSESTTGALPYIGKLHGTRLWPI